MVLINYLALQKTVGGMNTLQINNTQATHQVARRARHDSSRVPTAETSLITGTLRWDTTPPRYLLLRQFSSWVPNAVIQIFSKAYPFPVYLPSSRVPSSDTSSGTLWRDTRRSWVPTAETSLMTGTHRWDPTLYTYLWDHPHHGYWCRAKGLCGFSLLKSGFLLVPEKTFMNSQIYLRSPCSWFFWWYKYYKMSFLVLYYFYKLKIRSVICKYMLI